MSDRAIRANSRIVDIEQPGANMYGCLPCPECGCSYRWPNASGTIWCDDCGHEEQRDYPSSPEVSDE